MSEIARAELQARYPVVEGTRLVIYRGDDGTFWARPEAEFSDDGLQRWTRTANDDEMERADEPPTDIILPETGWVEF